MAKKKNKDHEPAAAPATSAKAAATPDAPPGPIDTAYARGNYALVRELAKASPSPRAKELLPLIQLDQVQVLIGFAALFVVALGAFLTLK